MKRFLTTITLITLAAGSYAQEPVLLSLNDCMDYALKHNYTVKNAKLDVQIQQAQINQQVSAAYPHINGKADLNYFNVPQRSFVDAGFFNPAYAGVVEAFPFSLNYAGDIGITTSQTIFDGSVFVALKARNTVMELARQNEGVSEETIRYNVYKAYNSLVIAQRQYELIKGFLSYARNLDQDVHILNQNGMNEKIDVERSGVQVNNLATDSIRIGNLLTTSEQMLKFQMGMNINTPIVLTDTALEQRKENTLALLQAEESYERVPEYQALLTGLKLNEYNVERYKMTALPSVSAFWAQGSNYGANKFGDMFIFDRYYANSTIGLQITMPIFNGLLRVNQLNEAKLNVQKMQNNIDNMKLVIDFQTNTSRTQLRNAVLQVQNQHRNVELASDVLDLARKKYKEGVGSNIEVTQAQNDQLQAENNYFSSLQDLINAEADLKKALGLLK